MWLEARKQERKVREVMVNFQKRAERRREHYEKTKKDPNQFLRIYGNKCKLHLDPSGGGRGTAMIPWQDDNDTMISRYDVRIHMDYIPDYSKLPPHEPSREEKFEEGLCHYERYRTLVLNRFLNVSESDTLAKIDIEEMYPKDKKGSKKEKQKSQAKAAIGYHYKEDKEEQSRKDEELLAAYLGEEVEEDEASLSSEDEFEVDMDIDVYPSSQIDRLNVIALEYRVPPGNFSRSLREEKSLMEEQKQARLADMEKSTLTGKKARRERRMLKEKHLHGRIPTPPSYSSRGSPTYEPYQPYGSHRRHRSRSSSHSSSPEAEGKVEYITEFGSGEGERKDSEDTGNVKSKQATWDSPSSSGRETVRERQSFHGRSHSPSHRRSSRDYHRRRRSRSRSLSRDRGRHSRGYNGRSRSRSRSWDRSRRRKRSHSRERYREYHSSRSHHSRSRSPRFHRSHSKSPRSHRSRSKSPRIHRSRSKSPRAHGSRSKSPRTRSKSPRTHRSRLQSPRIRRSRSRSPRPNRNRSPSPNKRATDTPETPKTKPVVASSKTKEKDKVKLTPQERLKKKMQAALSKQYKMDKKVQREKEMKKEVARQEREEELKDQIRRMKDGRSRSRSWSPQGYYDY